MKNVHKRKLKKKHGIKKLNPTWHFLRPSHARRENPKTPAPSIHRGTVARVRTIMTLGRTLDLCFGVWTNEGIFLTPA